MVNVHAFKWLKQFAKGTILLESALDAIERDLASDYDYEEWMALTYHLVIDPSCWKAIEVQFTQRLGIGEPNLGMSFSFQFSVLCPFNLQILFGRAAAWGVRHTEK